MRRTFDWFLQQKGDGERGRDGDRGHHLLLSELLTTASDVQPQPITARDAGVGEESDAYWLGVSSDAPTWPCALVAMMPKTLWVNIVITNII